LEKHNAPTELIIQAKADAAQGNNAILTVYDEIRLSWGDCLVVPRNVLELVLVAAGPRALALFNQMCQEYYCHSENTEGME
jgi:hypothetical protein